MNEEKKRNSLGLFLPIIIIGLICGLIITITALLTREQITLNEKADTIEMIRTVMPLEFNNNLYGDWMDVSELSTTVYRARKDGENVGLVFMPVTTTGYKGEIKIAIGVSYDGVISGVRIIEHRETEGLGDKIDQRKSNWITNFANRSLTNTANVDWAVSNDGGQFDQLSGATISPRSVINAVKNTLSYYEINRDSLYN